MPKFIMTIGIAGCGKSTWCEQNAAENDIILSSDALRAELLGDVNDQSQNGMIFEEMKRRTIVGLRGGYNIFYDATNLSFKNRFNTLREIRKHFPDIETECNVFAIPYEVCVMRNMWRPRHVPDEVIKKQISMFCPPLSIENWQHIEIIILSENDRMKYGYYIRRLVQEFGLQDNPHHTLTLAEHSSTCAEAIRPQSENYFNAALMHDFGKLYTKSFDENGVAHYFNHANFSSYIVLCKGCGLEVAQAIAMHMYAYDVQMAATWRKRAGEEVWEIVEALHKADMEAH